ncbi:universal stress protein [Actinopolymorpha sp. B9G3]|uniref:universal stress protein n=1 Tax=Actinopolymorpha sp. B9G3 TaxID=3158970 RepID=UPI0032D9674F
MIGERARTPIVVGVPGGASRPTTLDAPVRWAAREALIRGVPLWLVHAFLPSYGSALSTGGTGWTGTSGSIRADGDELGAAAHRAVRCLEQVASQLAAEYPELSVAMFARCGATVAVLSDIAGDAALLVVGRHSHGRVAQAVLGSVAAGCPREPSSPVVAVPARGGGHAAPGAPIVVGVDAEGPAPETLGFVFAEALVRGAPLRFLHCHGPGAATGERWLAMVDALTPYRAAFPSVAMTAEIVDGEPAEILVKESVTASLLVLGPGDGWTAGWRLGRLGEVGHEVLCQSAGPVVLVREAAHNPAGAVRSR